MTGDDLMDLNGMTALVTGGAGMIGTHITRVLMAEHGCKVRIIDKLHPTTHPTEKLPNWVPAEAEFMKGDVTSREDMTKALQGVDIVFHQAIQGYEPAYPACCERCLSDAAQGVCVLFDLIKELKLPVKKVVTASSMAIYGESSLMRKDGTEFVPDGYRSVERMSKQQWEVLDENGEECPKAYPMKESRTKTPPAIYHIAKYTQELATLAAGKELGISTTCLRYSIVHGPYQSFHNPYTGVISIFCARIMNGKSPVVFEDGQQTRDFCFAEDVARANIHVCRHPKSGGKAYNVGTGRGGDTMHNVASLLCELLDETGTIKPQYNNDFRTTDTRHIALDPTELMSLGWKPLVSLEEGMRRHVQWMKDSSGEVPEDKFDAAYEDMLAKGIVKR
mmetsp:Transcript_29433/g.52008  ORF Transcript_29433/g.52008 Transcript_29433/m.52008 type:complete len:391 (+) Transcript_29433:78-1250(+)